MPTTSRQADVAVAHANAGARATELDAMRAELGAVRGDISRVTEAAATESDRLGKILQSRDTYWQQKGVDERSQLEVVMRSLDGARTDAEARATSLRDRVGLLEGDVARLSGQLVTCMAESDARLVEARQSAEGKLRGLARSLAEAQEAADVLAVKLSEREAEMRLAGADLTTQLVSAVAERESLSHRVRALQRSLEDERMKAQKAQSSEVCEGRDCGFFVDGTLRVPCSWMRSGRKSLTRSARSKKFGRGTAPLLPG